MNDFTLNMLTGIVIIFAVVGVITAGIHIKHEIDNYIYEHSDHHTIFNEPQCNQIYYSDGNYSNTWGC